MGIALLFLGVGTGIYSQIFSSSVYYDGPPAYLGSTIPTWFANVIAVTFGILGIVLIALGANELNDWATRWLGK